MTAIRQLSLLALSLLLCTVLRAQLEVAHLFSKGQSATGFGAFLHVGVPVSDGDEIGGELGLYYFAPGGYHMAYVPLLVSYRHTLDHSGAGFYVEPFAGYSFGATDIQKTDASGARCYDASGNAIDQKLSGPTAGLGFGYIIPSASIPLNIGLRYEHVFVSGDPSPGVLSLRVSYSLSVGRKYTGR